MSEVDEVYRKVVEEVLKEGSYKPNRTGVDSISKFGVNYTIDNSEGFPLLTAKKMDGYRWDSMLHELLWYLSGEEHVSDLKEKTGIWDEWSDENDMLESAYGRFWRRYPYPDRGFEGEAWADPSKNDNVNYEGMYEEGQYTFDQLGHVIDNIKENPNSRRHVVSAWHPVNAAVSKLPPCHLMFIFNVQEGNILNLHLTQRSGDVALGVPFNIACYSLLQRIVAQETGLKVGKFDHSIIDAHIYCGGGERGEWYGENWEEVCTILPGNYNILRRDIGSRVPEDPDNYDHVPGLLKQINREPYDSPSIEISGKPMDELEYEDFKLQDYESYEGIKFGVAE